MPKKKGVRALLRGTLAKGGKSKSEKAQMKEYGYIHRGWHGGMQDGRKVKKPKHPSIW